MPTKVHLVKAVVFPRIMYGCESWTRKKAECRRTDVFELLCWRRLESPLDCKEIQPVHPKGNQSWLFIGRTDAEAETPILWPPDAKNWLIGKDPDAGKDWGQEEKGMTQEEMVGWHYWFNGHAFKQALGVGDGQGGLACCSPRSRKESDTTERLNWTELNNDLKKDATQDFCLYVCHFSCESEVKVKLGQSRLTLCDPMDYTAHGVLQARILEWVAFPFSRGIFPTQGSNPGIPHCGQILSQLSHKGGPVIFLTYCQIF